MPKIAKDGNPSCSKLRKQQCLSAQHCTWEKRCKTKDTRETMKTGFGNLPAHLQEIIARKMNDPFDTIRLAAVSKGMQTIAGPTITIPPVFQMMMDLMEYVIAGHGDDISVRINVAIYNMEVSLSYNGTYVNEDHHREIHSNVTASIISYGSMKAAYRNLPGYIFSHDSLEEDRVGYFSCDGMIPDAMSDGKIPLRTRHDPEHSRWFDVDVKSVQALPNIEAFNKGQMRKWPVIEMKTFDDFFKAMYIAAKNNRQKLLLDLRVYGEGLSMISSPYKVVPKDVMDELQDVFVTHAFYLYRPFNPRQERIERMTSINGQMAARLEPNAIAPRTVEGGIVLYYPRTFDKGDRPKVVTRGGKSYLRINTYVELRGKDLRKRIKSSDTLWLQLNRKDRAWYKVFVDIPYEGKSTMNAVTAKMQDETRGKDGNGELITLEIA